jgi:hypothetical protein
VTGTSPLPQLFSAEFGVAPAVLARLGVFDPSLNLDTKLFPDPLLLDDSEHPEFSSAKATFENYFDLVRIMIAGSRGDTTSKPWREAKARLQFPEIKGTCLGYGSESISGSGVGPKTAARLTKTAYDIISLGIDDPDLFMAMGLFEDDFGPDLIGDMFTNVCLSHILDFNARILAQLNLPTSEFVITTSDRTRHRAGLVRNHLASTNKVDVPVILMPLDILRDLPVALDWTGVHEVAAQNAAFRQSLNDEISHLWSKRTLESKKKLKQWALSRPTAFGDLLDLVHGMDGKPYDFAGDRLGELVWRSIADRAKSDFPLKFSSANIAQPSDVSKIVDQIIEQFIFLIEKRDLWKDLYTPDGKVRLEAAAQRMFFGIAYAYCKANGVDLTPEADTGRGPVDFKFSVGFKSRVIVEAKLSTNTRLVHGYEKQLEQYDEAEEAFESRYLILNVGKIGRKLKSLRRVEEERRKAGKPLPVVHVVDGTPKASASKSMI